jgi:hypothetical protein
MTGIGQCTISRSGPSQSLASTPSRNQPTALTQHALLRFRGGQLTLKQRAPGSSPGAPTKISLNINNLIWWYFRVCGPCQFPSAVRPHRAGFERHPGISEVLRILAKRSHGVSLNYLVGACRAASLV